MATSATAAAPECLIFQDALKEQEAKETDDSLSLMFFELANVPIVGYRVDSSLLRAKKGMRHHRDNNNNEEAEAIIIKVHQDMTACGNHTGGIVWETSYLLLNFLLARQKKLGRVLEVGAGCGLLGQVIGSTRFCRKVVMTEHSDAVENLCNNCQRHLNERVSFCCLDWCKLEQDATKANLVPHSFDTILGTDVIFTPSLVKPLLETLRYMAHAKTKVYLCLQIRCEDSHKLLLSSAADYQWKVKDVSEHLKKKESCVWGLRMECHLLKLTTIPDTSKKRKGEQDNRGSSSKRQATGT